MADDKSFELFSNYSSMEVGLDKLLLGVSLAICGYLGQTVKFGQIGLNIPTGYLLVMLLFVLSAALGVRRLERTRDTAKLNHLTLEIQKTLNNSVLSQDQLEQTRTAKKDLDARLDRVMMEAASAYRLRSWCLFVGLLGYVAFKVLETY